MVDEDPFDGSKFVHDLPVWIVMGRPAKVLPDQVPVQSSIMVMAGGIPCVTVFTDNDLAGNWIEHGDRSKSLVFGIIETPAQWLNFLRQCERAGDSHVGFDPSPTGPPAHILLLNNVIRAAVEAAGDNERNS